MTIDKTDNTLIDRVNWANQKHDNNSNGIERGINSGEVWLVGAGPGDPWLLTQWAIIGLATCDLVVYDALVNDAILNFRRKGAELYYAGKRGGKPSSRQDDISSILITAAKQGKKVCRLKGGDPFVFGRGAEETKALKQAGVRYRIVPGITSGIGGISYAGIPLTSRDTNSAVLFITGHGVGQEGINVLADNLQSIDKTHNQQNDLPNNINWQAVAAAAPTIIFYMAIKNAAAIQEKLLQAGRLPDEPIAIISHATTPRQKEIFGKLSELAELANHAETPAIVVLGKNVALAAELQWWDKYET